MEPKCNVVASFFNAMTMTDDILQSLKHGGHRLTKIRRAVVAILSAADVPMSAFDLKSSLERMGVRADRTTVYRETAFLLKNGVIHPIHFGDGKTRYRICPDNHHHHAICVRCSRVEDVSMEKDLEIYERRIVRMKSFKVLHHTLEFFGICSRCNG